MSPRVAAHLGLGAASLVLVYSIFLLHSRASEAKYALRARPSEPAPAFVLSDPSGKSISLAAYQGRTVVLCFSSISCPVSNDYRQRLAAFTRRFSGDPRVVTLRVNVGHGMPLPDRSTASVTSKSGLSEAALIEEQAPTLMDPDFDVAGRYAIETTPTFVVIDGQGVVRYRGSFDDNRNAAQVANHYCQDALEDVLHDRPVANPLTVPFGCTLKR
jgi:cytochrome oxidase Cu insertion factor (SCO1/SenC/PrrC family)